MEASNQLHASTALPPTKESPCTYLTKVDPLTSSLNGGEQSASRFDRLTSDKGVPLYVFDKKGGSAPDVWEKQKFVAPYQESMWAAIAQSV
jgi:hypothetical protein